jgi:hypothetical protein
MKKLIIAFALTATTLNAFAGTTATLLLKGNIPQILDISVAAETVASNLPLTVTQTNTKVATVTESSNSNTGYKITISSANQGKLVRVSGSEQFTYALAYDGSTVALSSAQTLTRSGASAVSVNKNVTVSYTGVQASSMVAGDYTDTVTFSIAAN